MRLRNSDLYKLAITRPIAGGGGTVGPLKVGIFNPVHALIAALLHLLC